jgi:hypothetical protein
MSEIEYANFVKINRLYCVNLFEGQKNWQGDQQTKNLILADFFLNDNKELTKYQICRFCGINKM